MSPSFASLHSSSDAPPSRLTLASPNPAVTAVANTLTSITAQLEKDLDVASNLSDLGLSHGIVKSAGDAPTVQQISIDCFESFQKLLDLSSEVSDSDISHNILPFVRHELGRLRIWAAEGGVLQSGHGSLDHQLREVPEVEHQVVRMLSELKEVLQEGLHSTVPSLLSFWHGRGSFSVAARNYFGLGSAKTR